MIFKDRNDAGQKLAALLKSYKDQINVIVLGLPRGGVIIAYEIAKELNAELDIIIARKISAPLSPELAIGAITSDGTLFIDEFFVKTLHVSQQYIDNEIKKEAEEANRRLSLYRKNKAPLNLKNKIVILVDDGIATGATMMAAIKSIKVQNAKKIIVATPVAPAEVANKIKQNVDEFVCIDMPEYFDAVGYFYLSFPQVKDSEVVEILSQKT